MQFSSSDRVDREGKEIIVSKEGEFRVRDYPVTKLGFVSNGPGRQIEPANEEEMRTRIEEIG